MTGQTIMVRQGIKDISKILADISEGDKQSKKLFESILEKPLQVATGYTTHKLLWEIKLKIVEL